MLNSTFKNILLLILPFLIAFVLNRVSQKLVRIPSRYKAPKARTYLSLIQSIISAVIYLTAAYFSFTLININVTPLFASAGVVGIIIGLGVRPFIEDFFTGLFILTQDTINIGDHVDVGGAEGTVESISLRTLNIKDESGAVHIFPNREIKEIINYSRRKARVYIDFPVKNVKKIDETLADFYRILDELKNDEKYGKRLLEGTAVLGIEDIHSDGTLLIRTVLVTFPSYRFSIGRRYRYLLVKTLLSHSLTK